MAGPSPSPSPQSSPDRGLSDLMSQLSPEEIARINASVSSDNASNNDPPLFWRWDNSEATLRHGPNPSRRPLAVPVPVIVPASQALDDFEKWAPTKLNNFIDQAIKAGLLQEGDGYFEAKALWKNLVQASVDKQHAGVNMNPFDVLSMLGGNGKLAQSKKPVTDTTSTNKNVDLTNPDDAR